MSIHTHKVTEYTKTNPVRLDDLAVCIEEIIQENIPGCFVETGVWRGGCCMLMAYKLKDHKIEKNIWMYDTYSGMTKPCNEDKKIAEDTLAIEKWEKTQEEDHNRWCYASLKDVKQNMASTGYNMQTVITVKGDVAETLPKYTPKGGISLLRLDTDFYESTKATIEHLYPKLNVGGYLIIDDYNCWKGAKKAIDDYFEENGLDINKLVRVDKACVKYKKGH